MILLWKAVVFEGGVQGLQEHPQKFLICWKSGQKPWKSGWKWCPTSFDFKKWRPRFTWKHMKIFFWRLHQKEVFMILWEKICRHKLLQKLFGQVCGNSGKILCTQKICLLLHLWRSGTSAPVAPLLNGQRGNGPRRTSILRLVCAYYSTRTVFTGYCGLQCVTAMNIIISGLLRQSSSRLQKYPATRYNRGVEHTQCYFWVCWHNPISEFVDTTCILFNTEPTVLTHCCTMCHYN